MKYFYTIVFILTTMPFYQVSADEIVLENGDRLTGTVKTMESDILTLETGYSEPIKIRKSKIRRVHIDGPAEIHLSGGEIIKGKVKSHDNGKILVELGLEREASVFQWESVASINPTAAAPSKWTGNVAVGAGLQTGNTDRVNAAVGAEASRRTESNRYSIRFLYNYAEEDDELSARNAYGAGKYDYFFTKKLYGYLGVELLNDEFKDLNLRTVTGPGVGYQLWEDAVKFLLLEAGVSYFSEDREEAEDEDWLTGRLAGNLRHNIKKAVTFSDYLIVYPSIEDFGEYKLRNEASLTSPLVSGWSLKIANILERDSEPPQDVKEDDWQWILGLQYNF
jgi:putative salt-induced outer membrane protein YdiY